MNDLNHGFLTFRYAKCNKTKASEISHNFLLMDEQI